MIKSKSLLLVGGLYMGGLGAVIVGAPILSSVSPFSHEAKAEVLKVVNESGSLQLMQNVAGDELSDITVELAIPAGETAEGIEVILANKNKEPQASAKTDTNGIAQLKGIRPGNYQLDIKAEKVTVSKVKHQKSAAKVSGVSNRSKAIYASGITAALGGGAIAIASGSSGSSSGSSALSGSSSANTALDAPTISGAPDVGTSQDDFAVFIEGIDPAPTPTEIVAAPSASNTTVVETPTPPAAGGPAPGQESTVVTPEPTPETPAPVMPPTPSGS